LLRGDIRHDEARSKFSAMSLSSFILSPTWRSNPILRPYPALALFSIPVGSEIVSSARTGFGFAAPV
jgi:hypothetical protein